MLQIKVNLNEEHEEKFLALQKHWSLSSYTETIRRVIISSWEQEISDDPNYIVIDPVIIKQLRHLVKRKDIQEKYYSMTVEDIINKAGELLLEDIKNNRKSIFDWNIRSKLNKDELLVTDSIAKVQTSRLSNDFTFQSLLNQLTWRNTEKLEQILDNFEKENLISSLVVDGSKIYHAQKP